MENKTNDELIYIMEYTDKKNEAAALLVEQLGITDLPNQDELIKTIAKTVLANPKLLNIIVIIATKILPYL